MAYSHDILLLIWQKRKQCQALILLYDFLSQGSGEEAAHFLSGLRRPHDLRARCYSTSFLPFVFVVSAEGPSTRVSSLPTATRPLWMSLLWPYSDVLLVQRLTADHPGRGLSHLRKHDIPHLLVQNNKAIVGHLWMQLMLCATKTKLYWHGT